MEWIDIDKETPPERKTVLLYIPQYENIQSGYFEDAEYHVHGNAIGEVTHWMTLPNRPTESTPSEETIKEDAEREYPDDCAPENDKGVYDIVLKAQRTAYIKAAMRYSK